MKEEEEEGERSDQRSSTGTVNLRKRSGARPRGAEENTFQAVFHDGMFRLQIKHEDQKIQTSEEAGDGGRFERENGRRTT